MPAVIENAGLARRFDGRTVAVTGASGLIGGALTRTFAQAQVPVRALDVREPPAWDGPLTLRLVDVRQADLLAEAVAGADYVFHEAGWKVPASDRDPAAAIDVLIQGTLNVAAACVATGAKLVFASTGAIYGDARSPLIAEDHPIRCDSFYSASKVGAEYLLDAAARCWGLEHLSLRYFSVYGPGMTMDGPDAEVLGRWTSQILSGGQPVIHGDGRQLRDFTHVDDVVQANLRAALSGQAGSAYNVGTGTGISLAAAADLLLRVAGASAGVDVLPGRPGGNARSVPDIGKARRELGYRPLVDRAAGFTGLVDWARNRLSALAQPVQDA